MKLSCCTAVSLNTPITASTTASAESTARYTLSSCSTCGYSEERKANSSSNATSRVANTTPDSIASVAET